MLIVCRKFMLSGLFSLALSTGIGAQVPPVTPNPAQGTVDSYGKFVPANPSDESEEVPQTAEEWQAAAAELIEKTGDDTFRVGGVQCDRTTRTLTIPARLNARQGVIEYALVTQQGKVHEALLATDAKPLHIQIAALLLGISPQPGEIKAHQVSVEVEWATNGPLRSVPLEELVVLAKGNPQAEDTTPMKNEPWHYTGSIIDSTGFAASREGSLIALINDGAALVANPHPTQAVDVMYIPNTAKLPADGVPLSVKIRLKSVPDDPVKP